MQLEDIRKEKKAWTRCQPEQCCAVYIDRRWRSSAKIVVIVKQKGKADPVTGPEGPLGCKTSRLPHFLRNRLKDGGEAVSLTLRRPFTARKIPNNHSLEAE
jgi:hypothetical protein